MALRVVLDTNVIFEGLTKQAGVCGMLMDAWEVGLVTVCVSNTLLHEYNDVLARKLSARRYVDVVTLLDQLLDRSIEWIHVYYTWRPMSRDPGDDHVIDCAMNGNAIVVTSNLRDFRRAREQLGLQILRPIELLERLLEN